MKAHGQEAHDLLAPSDLRRHLNADHDVDPDVMLKRISPRRAQVYELVAGIDPVDATMEERRLQVVHETVVPHEEDAG